VFIDFDAKKIRIKLVEFVRIKKRTKTYF